jgi:hypothetical protein
MQSIPHVLHPRACFSFNSWKEKISDKVTPEIRVLEKVTVAQLIKLFPLLWNQKVHYRAQKRPKPKKNERENKDLISLVCSM